MKPARIILWLSAVVLALLAWRYWPESAPPVQGSKPTGADNILPAHAAVEEPKIAPAKPADGVPPAHLPAAVNSDNVSAMDANRQETLDGLLKFQTALEQSLDTATDPRDRDALEHELASLQLQIQAEISPSTTRPVVATNLGEVALTTGLPTRKKLASGDDATLTASTTADGSWSINVIVRHTDASGATTDEASFITVQPGQAAVVKTTGNEIHFTPKSTSGP